MFIYTFDAFSKKLDHENRHKDIQFGGTKLLTTSPNDQLVLN